MKECRTYEPLIAELLFGALSSEGRARLDAHLGRCPACAEEVRAYQATLAITAQHTPPEPEPAFWDGYYDRLAARIEQDARPLPVTSRWARWWQERGRLNLMALLQPAWPMQGVAAVVLLLVGVGVGWLVFSPAAQDPVIADRPTVAEVPVQAASLEARTSRYLERSKVLLLGVVNLEPEQAEDTAVLNLPRKQAVARELVQEAATLKQDLSEADQQRLRDLIDDLEVTLMQIANLESGYDVPAIEMVKSSVDRRGLLLKINLSEMQQDDGLVEPAVDQRLLPDTTDM